MTDLDLTEAIEAAREEMALLHLGEEDDRRYIADAAVRAAAPIIERAVREEAAKRMRNLAAWLSAGWDLEPNPDPLYVAQGQAFQEAARRIRIEVADA